jgi:hypothetical protein
MKPALCRRQFVAHSIVLAGAALLLPAQRLSAAASLTAHDPLARAPQDTAHRSALALVGRYGSIASVTTGHDATRIVAHVRCFDSMVQTLGAAREHGIARVRAAGNLTTFELEGRRFEIENLVHAV